MYKMEKNIAKYKQKELHSNTVVDLVCPGHVSLYTGLDPVGREGFGCISLHRNKEDWWNVCYMF